MHARFSEFVDGYGPNQLAYFMYKGRPAACSTSFVLWSDDPATPSTTKAIDQLADGTASDRLQLLAYAIANRALLWLRRVGVYNLNSKFCKACPRQSTCPFNSPAARQYKPYDFYLNL